jgi:hypothetical protein
MIKKEKRKEEVKLRNMATKKKSSKKRKIKI